MGPRLTTASRLLVEMFLIAAAVVLGFAATEWGQNRRNHQTGAEALDAIRRELTSNLESVSRAVPYYRRISSELADVIQAQGDGPVSSAELEEWRGLSPPVLRSASFDLAISTGALEYVNFQVADMVSQSYEVQSNLTTAIDQALGAMVAGHLAAMSDWLRITALLGELTAQSQAVLQEALDSLGARGP